MRFQAPNFESLAIVKHLCNEIVPQAKQPKVHLTSTFPVRHLVLKKGDAKEHLRVLLQLHDVGQVIFQRDVQVLQNHTVVLCHKDWGVAKRVWVIIKELAFQITRRVVGVETVHPAIQKGFRDIILGLIAKGLWIQHCIHQGGHLAQGRQVAELIAHQANCIGEGRCDVDQISWLGRWHETHHCSAENDGYDG